MAHNEVALRCTRVHEKSKEMVTPLPTELHEALVETAHIVDNSSELMSVLQMIESLEKIADVMAESWERPQELFTRTRELETRDLGFEELVDSVFSEKSFTDLTTSVCRAGVITQAEVKRLFTNLKPHVASVESHFTDDTIGDDVEARGDDRRENSIRSMQEVYDYLEKQCGHYSVFVESLITRAPCVFACTRRNPELGEDVTELRVGHHPLGESIGILDYNSEKARWFLKDESELALSSEEAKELFYFYHNSMREAWVRKTARDLLIYPGKAEELSRILQDDKTTGSNKKIIALVAMKLAIIEGNAKRFYQIHKVLDDQVSDAFELFYKAVSGDKVPVMGYEVSLSDYFAEIISSPESFESLRDYLFPQ
ncbi:MAG: hypothetical protein L7U87_05115 [Chlamydiales bacterium]|nr:hypothetical protein [Chlamydiales bacterium]